MAAVTRFVTPIQTRVWTGSAWSPPRTVLPITWLVIPAPIRRWDGSTWVTLYTPQ